MSILKRGMKGVPVKRLQEKLGITADGDFGPATQKAVKDYQSANGLAVDGIAGPDTFTHMGLYELVLLRRGSRGAAVKRLQEGLGIGDAVDGKPVGRLVVLDRLLGGGAEIAVGGDAELLLQALHRNAFHPPFQNRHV